MKRTLSVVLAGAAMALAGCGMSGGGGDDGPVAQAGQAIVGGAEAAPHSLPFMVGLTFDGSSFCSGTIISNEWVLTAAHCLAGHSSVMVVAGGHNLNLNEPTQVRQTSTNLTLHEAYNPSTLQNDVGVIRLSTLLTFNANVQPVNLDDTGTTPVGQTATLAGWGRDSDAASTVSPVLRVVNVPTLSNAACAGAYGSIVTAGVGCTSGTGGKGLCAGDSGGAVLAGSLLIGVPAFNASAGCAAGYPSGYARVSSFRAWIQSNTGV
jgi:secreted trypsin-like serine protease